jgi:hypothetical protein
MALNWHLSFKKIMKERDSLLPQDKDRHLDVPAEANTEKHIDFSDYESANDQRDQDDHNDKATEERRRQWKEGLEEGGNARRND